MSKKLIAVASAAALALSALVGVAPASATVSVGYTNAAGSVSPQATAASATAIIDVPWNNSLEFTATADRSSLMKATVTTTSGQVVSVATTGKVRIVEEPTDATNKNTSASGVSSWSKTATSSSVVFYVYTTGSDAGSVKTTVGGNSTEVFLKGIAGPAYNVAVTLPASVGVGQSPAPKAKAAVTDIFGNPKSTAPDAGTIVPSTVATLGTWTQTTSTSGIYEATVEANTSGSFGLSVVVNASVVDQTDNGLAAPKNTFFSTLNSADLSAQVASLTTTVASLRAALAKTVTKAKYNNLVVKYNKITRGKKASLVK
jgi:hypothetical protein